MELGNQTKLTVRDIMDFLLNCFFIIMVCFSCSRSIIKNCPVIVFHSSQTVLRPNILLERQAWLPHEMVFKIPNLLPISLLPGILVLSSEKNLQAYCVHSVLAWGCIVRKAQLINLTWIGTWSTWRHQLH